MPDGEFQKPMDLNVVEKDAAARLKKAFNGERLLTIGRVANITQPLPGRTN